MQQLLENVMRTIGAWIAAAALVTSTAIAVRAAPLDCTSMRLSAMELTKCFPGLLDHRLRQPVDTAVASPEPEPSWKLQDDGRLVYGWPFSDIVSIVMICRGGMADVIIKVRPPHGKPGDETPIKFKNGTSEVQHTATLTELDGLSGDDVEFSIPTSDELFDQLMRDGVVVAEVPGASLTLPAQNGRTEAVTAFRKSCVSP